MPEKQFRKNPQSWKEELEQVPKTITDVDPKIGSVAPDIGEVNEIVKDPSNPDVYTESAKGKVASQFKAGQTEFDRGNVNDKFSIEHNFEADTLVTGKDSGKNPKHGTDAHSKPADETPTE